MNDSFTIKQIEYLYFRKINESYSYRTNIEYMKLDYIDY